MINKSILEGEWVLSQENHMGRRKSNYKGAFKEKQLSALIKQITTLQHRMHATNELNLTHDNFLELLVPPEDHYVMKRAPIISYVYCSECAYAWPLPLCRTRFTLRGANRPAVPSIPALQPTACPKLVEYVTQWLERHIEINTDFGRARLVLALLNDHCTNPTQVKFFWPSIMALCGQVDELNTLFAEARRPNHIPSLPVGLRQACQRSATTIALAQLLPELTKGVEPPVTITVVNSRIIEENGLDIVVGEP
jgi:hypothetical protein